MKRLLPLPYAVKFFGVLALMNIGSNSSFAQTFKSGNSYINISKKTVGGTVQPGDTLEIRSNYWFPNNYNSGKIYYVRYVDNVPTNTTFFSPGGEYLITNEGVLVSSYTAAVNDDPGTYKPTASLGPNDYNVRINIGGTSANGSTPAAATASNNPANLTGAGSLTLTKDVPRVSNGTLITTAFKVIVTGNVGDTITLGGGKLMFRKANDATASGLSGEVTIPLIAYKMLISNNDPICPDYIGKNFVAEAGGTFDSGTVQSRNGTGVVAYPVNYSPVVLPGGSIGDGYYSVVNNLSPSTSTNVNADRIPNCTSTAANQKCSNRMFNGHWDIMGDHTGSPTAAGNPPAASGANGGYMLIVNSDYATNEAYKQNITGLCPNTTYEFSLWVKNICPTCGRNMNDVATYTPGVLPNLTFVIDGLDRYSSGQIDYTGNWVKKGFLFKTSANQTSITASIRTNASGGGGNDWAIDDIALVNCNPKLNMVPTGNSNVCMGNQVDISTQVSAFFNNYTEFKWEKSIDNGVSWNIINSGTGTPTQPSSGAPYQYTANLPSFIASASDHMNQYRFTVASSAANLLDTNCAFRASSKIIVLVNNCQYVLKTNLLYFNGQLQDGYGHLNWKTENEDVNTIYEVERSFNGEHFIKVGEVTGKAPGSGAQYAFTDKDPVSDKSYYRLRVIEKAGGGYSKIALLTTTAKFDIQLLINPFSSKLSFDLIAPEAGRARVMLMDIYGRILKQSIESVQRGANAMNLYELSALSKGVYTLTVELGDKKITHKLVKTDQ